MVTIEYMKASAIRHRAHTVGRAFCRALGIDPGRPPEARAPGAYAGIRSCFRNHGSPMDGRR